MDKTPDLAAQMASLSQALAEQKSTLQETETALVARIADVDDDRRLHTKRLQRFWQKQRTEIEARVQRQAWTVGLAMVSFAALILIGAAFAYARLDAAQRELRDDIAQLRLAHEQLAALATQDQALRDSLSELSTKVATISATLEQRDDQAERASERGTTASSDDQERPPPSEPMTDSPSAPGDAESPPAESPATVAPAEVSPDPAPAPPPAAATSSAPSPAPVPQPSTAAAVVEPAQTSPDTSAESLTAAHAAPGSASPSAGEPAPDPGTATADRAPQAAEISKTESSAPPGTEPPATAPPATAPPPAAEAAAVEQAPTATEPTLANPETTAEAAAPGRQARISDDTLLVGDQPYALQLFGFSSQAGMLRFARRKDLPPRVYYREERYRDRPWFVLIHSLHPGYRDAAAAQAQLPSDLASLDTWIRELPAETKLSILEINP